LGQGETGVSPLQSRYSVVIADRRQVFRSNGRSETKEAFGADEQNLDLLVLGGWWGKGGRTGKISSLLCGLRVQQDDDGSGDSPE
jgi:hypothetical protein